MLDSNMKAVDMLSSQECGIDRFFQSICSSLEPFQGVFVVVAHILPTLPPFLRALEQIGHVAMIIPKPRSIQSTVLAEIRRSHFVYETTREGINDWSRFSELLASHIGRDRFILLDIGGYFAKILHQIATSYPTQLVGVVEDTENGHQKYTALGHMSIPCVSVARSFSKRNEDWLVGQSIVFSAEYLLRGGGTTLTAKKALVIGFGKIGPRTRRGGLGL